MCEDSERLRWEWMDKEQQYAQLLARQAQNEADWNVFTIEEMQALADLGGDRDRARQAWFDHRRSCRRCHGNGRTLMG